METIDICSIEEAWAIADTATKATNTRVLMAEQHAAQLAAIAGSLAMQAEQAALAAKKAAEDLRTARTDAVIAKEFTDVLVNKLKQLDQSSEQEI